MYVLPVELLKVVFRSLTSNNNDTNLKKVLK
jgi:hypothetical protein